MVLGAPYLQASILFCVQFSMQFVNVFRGRGAALPRRIYHATVVDNSVANG